MRKSKLLQLLLIRFRLLVLRILLIVLLILIIVILILIICSTTIFLIFHEIYWRIIFDNGRIIWHFCYQSNTKPFSLLNIFFLYYIHNNLSTVAISSLIDEVIIFQCPLQLIFLFLQFFVNFILTFFNIFLLFTSIIDTYNYLISHYSGIFLTIGSCDFRPRTPHCSRELRNEA